MVNLQVAQPVQAERQLLQQIVAFITGADLGDLVTGGQRGIGLRLLAMFLFQLLHFAGL